MVFILVLVAIAVGLAIGRNYSPKNKFHKYLFAFLIPIICGLLLAVIIAAIKDSTYFDFWYRLGQATALVIFAVAALIITLLVKLKVKDNHPNSIKKRIQKLHYGTGEDRVDFEMELTEQEIAMMEEMRTKYPEKWMDNDLELVKVVKNTLQADNMSHNDALLNSDDSQKEEIIIGENEPNEILAEQTGEEPQNKRDYSEVELEVESVKDLKTKQHWIRQNGTEMCIYIDDATFQQMITMQKENPLKWVDNEFNLFLAAQGNKTTNDREEGRVHYFLRRIFACIIVASILYGITASVVDHTVATCNENKMYVCFSNAKEYDFIRCDYSTFRYKMIANRLYRKKIYNLFQEKCTYKEFYNRFEIKNRLENPFVWVW